MKQLKWTTVVHYVDIDTGEILPKQTALTNYDLIDTIKEINYYEHEKYTSAEISRIKLCRTAKQLNIFS